MINIKKVAHQLKFDGMYNTIYIEAQEELKNEDPTVEEIEKLIIENEYYVGEYKELNRYGELSSVHAKVLIIDENEEEDIKSLKKNSMKMSNNLET